MKNVTLYISTSLFNDDEYQCFNVAFLDKSGVVIEHLPTSCLHFENYKFHENHIIKSGYHDPLGFSDYDMTPHKDSPITYEQAIKILKSFDNTKYSDITSGEFNYIPEHIRSMVDEVASDFPFDSCSTFVPVV